jgi:hypothetical protein
MMQILESIISILLIVSIFLIYYSPNEKLPEFDTINWRLRGASVLKSLDDNGELRSYVLANDVTTIKSKLSSILPVNLNYDVVLCDRTCSKPAMSSEKITNVVYLLAGDFGNITSKQVVLYMWGSD